jgi:hypothetical protein
MTHSFHLYLDSFILLLVFVSIISSVRLILKIRSLPENAAITYLKKRWKDARAIDAPRRRRETFIKIIWGVAIGFFIWTPLGYYGRDLLPNPYKDVLILKARDQWHYQVQPRGKGVQDWTLCKDSFVDWQPGDMLIELAYVQHFGCKSLVGHLLGYRAYRDDNGVKVKYPIPTEVADAGN